VKIATRLTILLVILTFIVALTVGWFAVAASSRTQYAALNGEINAVVASGNGQINAALSNALNVVQQSSFNLTLDVIDRFGGVVQINAGTVVPKRNPTLADAKASLHNVISVTDLPGFRIPIAQYWWWGLPGRRRFLRHHYQAEPATVVTGGISRTLDRPCHADGGAVRIAQRPRDDGTADRVRQSRSERKRTARRTIERR
jgi:hypothetical protein